MDQDIIWFSQLCLTVEKYFVRFLKICILKHPNNGFELTHLYDKDKKVRFLPIFSCELHKIQQFYWVIGLINLSIDFLHKGLFINLFAQIDLKYHQLKTEHWHLIFEIKSFLYILGPRSDFAPWESIVSLGLDIKYFMIYKTTNISQFQKGINHHWDGICNLTLLQKLESLVESIIKVLKVFLICKNLTR